ncbi:MAG: hypothetical protein JXM69_12195 [Anaerolineae bacterium]|nr:hypothetical protein [Anaerolineae bacterium]
MMSILLIVGCGSLGLVMLIGLIVGVILVLKSGQRDAVSQAREDWIRRRSEKDEQGW